MGQITVIRRDGTEYNLFNKDPFCTISSATHNFTLMGDDNIQLSIKSEALIDFAIGDKIILGGNEYSIRTKATREILSDNIYSYEITFYGVMYELMKCQYRNADASGNSSKSSFDLTYSLSDFIKVIIYNINRDYPGQWVFDADNCPETEPKTIQFAKNNCLQVLQSLCKDFKYEFRIDQENGVRTIRIGKFGDIITPPGGRQYFEWGKGNGLYKLREQKVDDKSIITRLWIEGGSKNIKSEYRDFSDRLQLPFPMRLNKKEHILSDGTIIPAMSEYIGLSDDSRRYIEDETLKAQIGSIEDTEFYDDIFPFRTGTVTALGSDIYSFVDDTMDFDLNEKDENGTKYLISGVSAKINFITGKLAGQQFELKKDGGYNADSKTFSIIKFTDERGVDFPTESIEAFRISIGDKYKITDINLPDSYVENAEEELWYAGYDDFLIRKQVRAQYILTFDRSYFINHLPYDSNTELFKCGDYVPVRDERFNLEKNIRIQKITRNLLIEHDYVITLSDTTAISVQTQTILDVREHNTIIRNHNLKDVSKARRGWRTTEDLKNMVYDVDGYFNKDNIKPNSIDTNMLSVGSKSQQFQLLDVVFAANASGLPNKFDASSGVLAHLTISKDGVRFWNMAAISVTLTETGGYYVFAKCSKDGDNGVWHITQEQLKAENVSDPNNYYFQVGIISSIHTDDNFRDFATTYGFSRINGNTITTGIIKSADGVTYLNLDDGVIGGRIRFLSGESEQDMEDWASQSDSAIADAQQAIVDAGIVISEAQQAITNVQNELSDTQTAVSNLDTYVKGSFHDGIIEEVEAKAIEKYINQLNAEGAELEAMYNKLYLNPLLAVPAKTNLLNAKISCFGDLTLLIDTILNAVADGKVTAVEKADVDYYFAYYKSSLSTFSTRIEEANQSIQQAIKTLADTAQSNAEDAEAKADIARAVTDKFGTTIDGGLINSVMMLLRDINETTETAGISGIRGSALNNPAFWAGGTYSQALGLINFLLKMSEGTTPAAGEYNDLAKISMLHNGAAKVGDFIIESNGRIVMVDPETGKARLVFNTTNIPTVASLISGITDDGSVFIYGDSVTHLNNQITLGSFQVGTDNTRITFGGTTLDITATSSVISSAAATLRLIKNGGIYQTLGTVMVSFGNEGMWVDRSNTTTVHPISLNGCPAGNYSLQLIITEIGGVQSMSASTGPSMNISWEFKQEGIRYFQYGLNGMMAFYSNEHFHFTEGKGLDVRGATNMPGVLLSATVASGGGTSDVWGAKKPASGTATRNSTGRYTVYHSVGHSKYQVTASSPAENRSYRIASKGTSSFVIEWRTIASSPALIDTAFDFVITGNNYN